VLFCLCCPAGRACWLMGGGRGQPVRSRDPRGLSRSRGLSQWWVVVCCTSDIVPSHHSTVHVWHDTVACVQQQQYVVYCCCWQVVNVIVWWVKFISFTVCSFVCLSVCLSVCGWLTAVNNASYSRRQFTRQVSPCRCPLRWWLVVVWSVRSASAYVASHLV